MTLLFVEDFLEFLHGTMDRDGNALARPQYASPQVPIKLATYDKSPVASMGTFCSKARSEALETCLTDKQVELARKIIMKYRRQLHLLGIELPANDQDIPLRHKTRSVDRTQVLGYLPDEKKVTLRFPYNPKKISFLHEYSATSAGLCEWNNTDRKWIMDLTEGNLQKILGLFEDEDLKIDNALEPIVIDVMKSGDKDLPSIIIKDGIMELVNCHPGVHSYMSKLSFDPTDVSNLAKWCSHLVTLGVRIDASVNALLIDMHGEPVLPILTKNKINMATKNLPMGEWYDHLLEANDILVDFPWLLHLSFWTKETNWQPFKNLHDLSIADQHNNRQNQYKFAEKLVEYKDPIVILDSVIGNESLRSFVEQNSLKVIYINDIGLS